MIRLSKILAFIAALALANLVIYIGFFFAVFGQLNLFYFGVGLINLLVCGLTFRRIYRQRENQFWTGLEFIVYGLVAISARFIILDIAYVTSGALIVAGILGLAGSRFAQSQNRKDRIEVLKNLGK